MSYELIHDSIRDSGSEYGPGWIAQNKNGNWYWFSDNPASSHWALSLEEV